MVYKGTSKVMFKAFFDKELAKEVVEKAALKGLRKLGEEILSEAQTLCPVDTGTLRRSGSVRASSADNTVKISFNTPYALRQHEEMSYNHPKGGQAKYLEQPFNSRVKEAQYYAEKEIAKATYKKKAKEWGY